MTVNLEKGSNWLFIRRKSQIICDLEKFSHFLRSHPTDLHPSEVCKSPIGETLTIFYPTPEMEKRTSVQTTLV